MHTKSFLCFCQPWYHNGANVRFVNSFHSSNSCIHKKHTHTSIYIYICVCVYVCVSVCMHISQIWIMLSYISYPENTFAFSFNNLGHIFLFFSLLFFYFCFFYSLLSISLFIFSLFLLSLSFLSFVYLTEQSLRHSSHHHHSTLVLVSPATSRIDNIAYYWRIHYS